MEEITAEELKTIIASNPEDARHILSQYITNETSLDRAVAFIGVNGAALDNILSQNNGYALLANAINEHESFVLVNLPALLADENLSELREAILAAPENVIASLKFEGIGLGEKEELAANIAIKLLTAPSDVHGQSNLDVLQALSENPDAYQAVLELSTRLSSAGGELNGLQIEVDGAVEEAVLATLVKMDFDAIIDRDTARLIVKEARSAQRDSAVTSCIDINLGRIGSIAKGETGEVLASIIGFDADDEGFVDRALVEGIAAPTIKNIVENGCSVER